MTEYVINIYQSTHFSRKLILVTIRIRQHLDPRPKLIVIKTTEVIISRSKNKSTQKETSLRSQPFTVITFSSDVLNVDIKLLKVLVGFRRTPVP